MATTTLRDIPNDLYRALGAAAEGNHRSINKEIIARLEASFRSRRVSLDEELRQLDELRASLGPAFTWGDIDEAKSRGRE